MMKESVAVHNMITHLRLNETWGEGADEMGQLPAFYFDGGFMMTSWDGFDEGVQWYTEHMGWTFKGQVLSGVGKMAFFGLPAGGQVTLKSFDSKLPHLMEEGAREGNSRLCFSAGDLAPTQHYFRSKGIRMTEVRQLPGGYSTYDLYAYEGARFTVIVDPALEGKYPDCRIPGFGRYGMILGVSDLEQSVLWYEQIAGLRRASDQNMDGNVVMSSPDGWSGEWRDCILLQQLPQGTQAVVHDNPRARGYFLVKQHEFLEAYTELESRGLKPSEIAGSPGGWAAYHFFDPDGNRINVWTFPM